MHVLAQAESLLTNVTQFGMAGAVLIVVFGFVRYQIARDADDRQERKEMSEGYHRVIDNLANKVEANGNQVAAALRELTSKMREQK